MTFYIIWKLIYKTEMKSSMLLFIIKNIIILSAISSSFQQDRVTKFFNVLRDQGYGSVNILNCKLKKDTPLEDEILCGLDKSLSTRNLLIYSGFIYPENTHIFCIDLVIDNTIPQLPTNYIWWGKCYVNKNTSPTELFLNHTSNYEITQDELIYSTTNSLNNELLFRVKSPSLTTPKVYQSVFPQVNQNLTTQHIHTFREFYSESVLGRKESMCETNLSTSIMNINFKDPQGGIHFNKIDDIKDQIFISGNLASVLGISSELSTEIFDECHESHYFNLTKMDTFRAVSVLPNQTMPPLPGNKTQSRLSEYPEPFLSGVGDDFLIFNGLHNPIVDYNINNRIMEMAGYSSSKLIGFNLLCIIAFLINL